MHNICLKLKSHKAVMYVCDLRSFDPPSHPRQKEGLLKEGFWLNPRLHFLSDEPTWKAPLIMSIFF